MIGESPRVSRVRDGRIARALHGNLYLSITNRCTLRCVFCPKFERIWDVQGTALRVRREPSVAEIIDAVGDPHQYRQIVFCGLGEPTLRLYELLEVASRLRSQGSMVGVNTDGLANLVYGRDITPDLEDNIDTLSISLIAQDESTYNRLCRPRLSGAYPALLDFAERARDFVPDITLVAFDGLQGVDLAACAAIAERLRVKFQRRAMDEVV